MTVIVTVAVLEHVFASVTVNVYVVVAVGLAFGLFILALLNPVAGDTLQKYIRRNFWTALTTMDPLGNMDSLKMNIHKNTWNEYHLVVKGNHLLHYVNNVLMSEVTDNDLRNRKLSGLMGVQVHVGPPMVIRYRNFRMKVL